MLTAGQAAPMFVLPDADMELIDIAAFQGKANVILYFYPRDDAPCCTLQATDFSDHEDEFARFDCRVLGVSRDDCLKHAEFRDKHGISVSLLSDVEGQACRQYDVWQAKEVNGVPRYGILRSTFFIDKKGIIRLALYGVTAKGHALEMLRAVKELSS
ncbi:MAG: peroxiredoxin [Candidatus Accumulibacter sp.]|uniref:peroxiredoxin n=1 Tax=Accumulibacter sp. TaxID=2053492 RepID=UPI00287991C6|nr:peroxiredoxin [Accumulibacter sp.]MDS4013379.1 peroxiredoxin [Accumulibacter sp.]